MYRYSDLQKLKRLDENVNSKSFTKKRLLDYLVECGVCLKESFVYILRLSFLPDGNSYAQSRIKLWKESIHPGPGFETTESISNSVLQEDQQSWSRTRILWWRPCTSSHCWSSCSTTICRSRWHHGRTASRLVINTTSAATRRTDSSVQQMYKKSK